MITIVCTTNRPESNSMKLSKIYARMLGDIGQECQILDMKAVQSNWILDSSYGPNTTEFDEIVGKYIRSVTKLIFITPEYNGSYPGYVKYFMDACDWGDFNGKKIALTGLATGRSGNLRGLDHFTGLFHFLGSEVYSKKVYLSQVNHALSDQGELTNEITLKEIEAQLKGFVTF
ncbi:MAG: NAD(P)H-dependent oxidoreductase [Flavobacteriales bacterium]|nr:NAD(P)H-dependent oxidoreductase [Flavobacteriales bacterium]